MKYFNHIFSIILCTLVLGVIAYAETSGGLNVPQGGTGITTVSPGAILVGDNSLRLTSTTSPTVGYITATSTTATSTFNGNIYIKGNAQIDGKLFAPLSIVSSGNATINGTLGVTQGANFATVSGNVGVGTTSPLEKLHVYSANNAYVRLESDINQASGFQMYENVTGVPYGFSLFYDGASSNDFLIQSKSSGALTTKVQIDRDTGNFGIGGDPVSAKLYVNGNVGIGTTTPWAQLSVNPNGITGPAFAIGSSTATNFVVTNGGNVGVGTAGPGYKLDISDSNNYGSVRITGASGGGFVLGSWSASTGGFWSNGLTPGSTNYSLLANSTGNTFLNAASGQMVYLLNANGTNPGQLLVNQYGVSINNGLVGATSGNGLVIRSGNVGIGTTSPYAKLSVHAGATDTYNPTLFAIGSSTSAYATSTLFTVLANGNVGVGITNPGASLEVAGSKGNADSRNFKVTYPAGGSLLNTELSGLAHLQTELGLAWTALYAKQGSASYAGVFNGKTIVMNGNVGIGTSTPTNKLTITDSTASQLTLSAGAGIAQWAFRNAGGNLYLATTTVAGTATTTSAAFSIDGSNGVASFFVPHAQISSLEDQTCTVQDTAYPITFNSNDDIHNEGISHSTTVDNATTTINYEGSYEIVISAIARPDTVNKTLNIWLNVNNENIANSNTRVELANSVDSIVSVSLVYHFMKDDNFQLQMSSNDAGTILDYTAASAPAPASPSIIMTVKKISN